LNTVEPLLANRIPQEEQTASMYMVLIA